jgi:exodeoxyribonuclease V beta subunit
MTQHFRSLERLTPGITLIEASAGTGKTYTITSLVLRLVVEENIEIDRILVVTFTEAATAELQSRIRSRLRDAYRALDVLPERPTADAVFAAILANHGVIPFADGDEEVELPCDALRGDEFVEQARRALNFAITSFDKAHISTIHGFCQRTLRENAFESGLVFENELIGDPTDLIAEAVADFWVNRQHCGDRPFLRYLEKQDITPERLVPLARAALQNPSMPILPEAPEAVESVDFARWETSYSEARDLWVRESEHILQILHSASASGRIARTTYRDDQISKYAVAIAAFFAGDAFQMAKIPAGLGRLSSSTIRAKTNSGKVSPEHPFFDASDVLTSIWERITKTHDERLLAFERELVEFVRTEIPRRKARAQVQSFDDLLNQLDVALGGPGGVRLQSAVRGKFDVALIDEFQDTDPVQYRIFSRIFGRPTDTDDRAGRLFLIGDPKQAIYAFRGADIFAYIEAGKAAESKRTLPRNHRSAPKLVAAVNALFARCKEPFGLKEIEFHPVDTPPTAHSKFRVFGRDPAPFAVFMRPAVVPGEVDRFGREPRFPSIADCVAAQIVMLLRSGATLDNDDKGPSEVAPGDIAVLVRSNKQGLWIQRALQSRGVPCVIQDGTSVFRSEEARELQLLLHALVEPNRLSAIRAALTTGVLGLTGDDLLRLDGEDERWDAVSESFRDWRGLWRRRGFVHAFRAVLAHKSRLHDPENPTSPPGQILRRQAGERRMTNLLHLAELLHDAESKERMSPAGLLRWLAARRADGGDSEASQLRMESDAAAVKVTTIHKSKGLEFPIVYCPFLSGLVDLFPDEKKRLRFHDAADDRRLKMALAAKTDQADPEILAQAEHENFGESMRLLYVALTRARDRCVVIWDPSGWKSDRSSLGWLLFSEEGDTREALGARIRGLSEAEQFQRIKEIADAAPGAIDVRALRSDVQVRLEREEDRDVRLEVRRASRELVSEWKISSYSGLVAGAREGAPSEDGHDHGQDVALPSSAAGVGERVLLADVEAGARFGRMIHQVFEHVDFVDVGGTEGRAHVDDALSVHGFEAELAAVVGQSVADTVATPLDGSGIRLKDISRAARLDELEFLFPVRSRVMLSRDRLAAAFETHGGPHLAPVAEAISRLEFEPFAGFLKGFVDLTFEANGRWYIVDYKSNDLGPTADAYHESQLPAAMLHGFYHLQYHLYVVALRRYLRWRVPGWNYETDFGGAYYLFLRGMHPDRGPSYGVFRDTPPLALIKAIDLALDEGGR